MVLIQNGVSVICSVEFDISRWTFSFLIIVDELFQVQTGDCEKRTSIDCALLLEYKSISQVEKYNFLEW